MNCATENCDRTVPAEGHRFCDACLAVVLRTSRPPELPTRIEPEWLRRARRSKYGLARPLDSWRGAA